MPKRAPASSRFLEAFAAEFGKQSARLLAGGIAAIAIIVVALIR